MGRISLRRLTSADTDHAPVVAPALRSRVVPTVAFVIAAALVGLFIVAAARSETGRDSTHAYSASDVGFVQDMIDHHQQALLIANSYLAANASGGAAVYAREVLLVQEREIGLMDAWLAEAGMWRGASGRMAMAWMGMPTSVDRMPGMQDPERIGALAMATGSDADRLFFDLMSAHHLGGLHMADGATSRASRPEIRQLAETMAANQRAEIGEYAQAVARLGL